MNIVDLFARGNQEMFHSAFIAWLFDEHGSHGLGSRFLGDFISILPAHIADRLTGPMSVRTEYQSERSRFDILLEPRSSALFRPGFRGLVLENKVKSFGSAVQLDKYVGQGYDVLALALLPETLADEAKRRYTVVTYARVRDLLQRLVLDPANHYHFLISEYRAFLTDALWTYELIGRYCNGGLSLLE